MTKSSRPSNATPTPLRRVEPNGAARWERHTGTKVLLSAHDANEHTLDRVRYDDYVLDLRAVRSPSRAWFDRARPTRSIGTDCTEPEHAIALGRTQDILIHLHRVAAARLRDR